MLNSCIPQSADSQFSDTYTRICRCSVLFYIVSELCDWFLLQDWRHSRIMRTCIGCPT
jgi:uncharacterized PurR-regulated membrane protein YhhQ (DUF165 family)